MLLAALELVLRLAEGHAVARLRWRVRSAPRRAWRALLDQFRWQAHVHEHTRVEYRRWPFGVRIRRVPSIDDRIATEGVVKLDAATYHLTEPVVITGGQGIVGRGVHSTLVGHHPGAAVEASGAQGGGITLHDLSIRSSDTAIRLRRDDDDGEAGVPAFA